MKDNLLTKPNAPGKFLQVVSFAALLVTLFLPGSIYADAMDKCLLEALKYADDSATVGQLREQCREELGTRSMGIGLQESSAGAKRSEKMVPENKNANGPEEMILKTAQARKPAFFPHKVHQDKYGCGTCHHGKSSTGKRVEYTEETVIYKCRACHNADMPNKDLNSFQSIGHQLCRECHRKHQDITSAKCSTCHRKNP